MLHEYHPRDDGTCNNCLQSPGACWGSKPLDLSFLKQQPESTVWFNAGQKPVPFDPAPGDTVSFSGVYAENPRFNPNALVLYRDDAHREWYASWDAYDMAQAGLTPEGRAAQARGEVYELERMLAL